MPLPHVGGAQYLRSVMFGLLGPLLIHDGHQTRPLAARRQRALLAALLLQPNRVLSRTALAQAVWDGSPPAAAETTLHSYAMRLRKALGPVAGARVITLAPGYLVELDPAELDVDVFAGLRAAGRDHSAAGRWEEAREAYVRGLDLWRGEPLVDVEGLAGRDEEVHRLEELRLQTVEARIDADLRLGADVSLIAELSALTTRHPYRERLAGQLMLALYRCGRQGEAGAVYRLTRRTLAEEIGVEPGQELRALHRRILGGDPDLAHETGPVAGGAYASTSIPAAATAPASSSASTSASDAENQPAPAPAPAQLPPPIADFTGREEHIQLIRDLLADAECPPRAIAITGIGGVGKTTLALQAAFQLRADFPGGRLFASMAGTTDRPAVPADVQRRFLKSLGVKAEALPTDSLELTASYRSTLSELRLLIVLDDVRDAQQARDLLPTGAGSAAIVTSRASLTGLEGATAIELTGLTAAESRDLLGRLAGPGRITGDAEAADAVVRSCSGLPLAVRISGARLAARPGWRIRDLADRLAD